MTHACHSIAPMVPVRLLHASQGVTVRFKCYEPEMGQDVCRMVFPLSSGVCCRVKHHGFASFVVGSTHCSSRAQILYCTSMEVHWRSVDDVHCCFPYVFADGHTHYQFEAALPSRKGDASEVLDVGRLYATRSVVLAVPTAELCSIRGLSLTCLDLLKSILRVLIHILFL